MLRRSYAAAPIPTRRRYRGAFGCLIGSLKTPGEECKRAVGSVHEDTWNRNEVRVKISISPDDRYPEAVDVVFARMLMLLAG